MIHAIAWEINDHGRWAIQPLGQDRVLPPLPEMHIIRRKLPRQKDRAMEDREKPTQEENHEPTTTDELPSEDLSDEDLEKVVGGSFLSTIMKVGKVGKQILDSGCAHPARRST